MTYNIGILQKLELEHVRTENNVCSVIQNQSIKHVHLRLELLCQMNLDTWVIFGAALLLSFFMYRLQNDLVELSRVTEEKFEKIGDFLTVLIQSLQNELLEMFQHCQETTRKRDIYLIDRANSLKNVSLVVRRGHGKSMQVSVYFDGMVSEVSTAHLNNDGVTLPDRILCKDINVSLSQSCPSILAALNISNAQLVQQGDSVVIVSTKKIRLGGYSGS